MWKVGGLKIVTAASRRIILPGWHRNWWKSAFFYKTLRTQKFSMWKFFEGSTLEPIWKSDLHCTPDSTTSETASYSEGKFFYEVGICQHFPAPFLCLHKIQLDQNGGRKEGIWGRAGCGLVWRQNQDNGAVGWLLPPSKPPPLHLTISIGIWPTRENWLLHAGNFIIYIIFY